MSSRILTVEQAAELLQVRPKTVRALAAGGSIPAVKVGKPWRFDELLLREWLVAKSRENETRLPSPLQSSPRLGGITARPAAGSLADRLDQMLADPGNVLPLNHRSRKAQR